MPRNDETHLAANRDPLTPLAANNLDGADPADIAAVQGVLQATAPADDGGDADQPGHADHEQTEQEPLCHDGRPVRAFGWQ